MTSSTDPVLALGRELTTRLDDWDLLGHWMAHHLAQLIQKAQDSEDPADADAAAEMILEMWRQRHTLGDKYPLHNYDAIFNTLDYLGDRTAASRLKRQFGTDGPSDAERGVNVPLQLVVGLEESLQDIQMWLLSEAADAANDRDAPWVQLALELRENDEARALRRLQRSFKRFQIATHEPTSDESADSLIESITDPRDATQDDLILVTLDRSIDVLTKLRAARASQAADERPPDNQDLDVDDPT